MYKVQDEDSVIQPTQLYMRIGILLTCMNHIISLREEVWAQKISLTSTFLLKCQYQARKVSSHIYVCLGCIKFVSVSMILLDFRIVLTVWYFFFFLSLYNVYFSIQMYIPTLQYQMFQD